MHQQSLSESACRPRISSFVKGCTDLWMLLWSTNLWECSTERSAPGLGGGRVWKEAEEHPRFDHFEPLQLPLFLHDHVLGRSCHCMKPTCWQLSVCLFFFSLSLSPPLSLLIQFTPWLEFVWRSDLWRRLITTIAGAGLLFMHPLASVAARKNGWGSGLTCTKSPLLCSLHQKTLFCLGAFIGALWAVSLWSRSTHPHPASAWRLECKVARPDQESTVDPCNAISCVWPACLQCVCIVCGCFDAVCLLQALVESLEEDAETEVLQSLLLLPQSQSDLFDAIGVQWSTTVQRAFDCLLIDKAVERHPVS